MRKLFVILIVTLMGTSAFALQAIKPSPSTGVGKEKPAVLEQPEPKKGDPKPAAKAKVEDPPAEKEQLEQPKPVTKAQATARSSEVGSICVAARRAHDRGDYGLEKRLLAKLNGHVAYYHVQNPAGGTNESHKKIFNAVHSFGVRSVGELKSVFVTQEQYKADHPAQAGAAAPSTAPATATTTTTTTTRTTTTTTTTGTPSSTGSTKSKSSSSGGGGMHPFWIVLLAIAGIVGLIFLIRALCQNGHINPMHVNRLRTGETLPDIPANAHQSGVHKEWTSHGYYERRWHTP